MMTVPTTKFGFGDLPVPDASTFLGMMSPTHTAWVENPAGWIFRGQGNAEWALLASAYRANGPFARFGISEKGRDRSAPWSLVRDLELDLLDEFRLGLEDSGVVIPAKSPEIKVAGQRTIYNPEPPESAFPLMALAQHHGLPTMLLDWSRRARVAAYFAAVDVCTRQAEKRSEGTHLAVFALNIEANDSWTIYRDRPTDGAREYGLLRPYQAPGGTNPNLRAQSGIFTLLSSLDGEDIEQHLAKWTKSTQKNSPLIRITLPQSEAPRLLRLLSYEGVHGASMFPGADGVVRAMRERALWDRT